MPTDERRVELALNWNVPDDIVARYATNMVIQQMEHEFIISFFEVKPPMILGEPEQIQKQLEKLSSVSANCVAQIIIARDKMPSFVEAMEINLKRSFPQKDTEK